MRLVGWMLPVHLHMSSDIIETNQLDIPYLNE